MLTPAQIANLPETEDLRRLFTPAEQFGGSLMHFITTLDSPLSRMTGLILVSGYINVHNLDRDRVIAAFEAVRATTNAITVEDKLQAQFKTGA